ncbi:MAG: hypothetical protein RSG77_22580 [Hafnia sp.]
MTLRKSIAEIIQTDGYGESTVDNIVSYLEDEGLGLEGNGWLEGERGDPNSLTGKMIAAFKPELGADTNALIVLITLDMAGLSLIGNGWLDDDPEAVDLIYEQYDLMARSLFGNLVDDSEE